MFLGISAELKRSILRTKITLLKTINGISIQNI